VLFQLWKARDAFVPVAATGRGLSPSGAHGMMRAVVRVETKPIWTSSSFLIYTGGGTVLIGAGAGLSYLALNFDASARAMWSLLFLVIVYAIANALLLRDRWLAAGILAVVSVILWAIFLFYLFSWWGWNGVHGSFDNWSWSRLLFWFLVLASASYDHLRFKFPFIAAISVAVFYLLVVDLLTWGPGKHGNWFALVTLFIGLLYLLVGSVLDKPSAFWFHFVGGALIGYSLLSWFHTSDFDFAMISVFSVVFVFVAYVTKRSSWAVYGTIGFFAATIHYLIGSPTQLVQGIFGISQQCITGVGQTTTCASFGSHISPWSPALAFGLLGFWLILLGMLGKRRKKHPAVVVETTTVVVEPAAG
jgi:hypothetical protein